MDRFASVPEVLRRYIDDGEIAGAGIRVRLNGEMIVDTAMGYADVAAHVPVTPDTLFRLCSMTKPITGVLAMTLVERGQLQLDVPVMRWLPEYAHAPGLTVRMLMDHSCGILEGPNADRFHSIPEETLAERIRRMARVPFDFEPGTGTGYSGLGGLDVLGRIIEVAAGMSIDDYLRDTLTGPLGMADTTFTPTPEQLSRLARLYEYTPGQPLKDVGEDEPLWLEASPIRNRAHSGSGGLMGTLRDYERFAHMLLNEGELEGVRILKPESVRLMHTPSAANGLELHPGCIWGLSMLIFRDNARSGYSLFDGTYGWSGAYGTHFFIAPGQSLEVTMVMNRSNIGGADSHIARAVEKAVYEALR